jgi:prepilin-type processing-associated H-X9-DG protein
LAAVGVASFEYGLLYPALGGTEEVRSRVLHCPADDLREPSWGYTAQRNFSYSYNYQTSDQNPPLPTRRLQAVSYPAQKLLLCDERRPNDAYFTWRGSPADEGADRHLGQGNQLFFDGHVELLDPSTIWNNADYYDLAQ